MPGLATVDPIQHIDLGNKVYQVLRQKILSREFRGGDKVSIHELADQLGVSRTPVKDAINRLAQEEFLEILPRRGTYVVPVTARSITEVFEVRETLELWAAERGVRRVTDEALAAIREAVADGRRVVTAHPAGAEGHGRFPEQNDRFHLLLIEQGGNSKVVELYRSLGWIRQLLRLYYRRPTELQMDALDAQREHEEILRAYEARNLPTLQQLLRNHLGNCRRSAMQILEANGGAL